MKATLVSLRVSLARVGTLPGIGLLLFAAFVLASVTAARAENGGLAVPAAEAPAGPSILADAAAPGGLDQAPVDLAAGRRIYAYWAKLVCGIQQDPRDLRLAAGAYATTINIGNPGEAPAEFTKTLALAIPPGYQKPGKVELIAKDKLPGGAALATDCEDIQRRLFPGGWPAAYVDGFVVIKSPTPLEVTGVYSTGSLDADGRIVGNGGIDIEPIAPRIISQAPPGKADLIVSGFGPMDVSCPQGGGSCVTRIEVRVANIGSAAAGPFQVRVVLDPASSVVVIANSAGLAAGASQTFAIVTPPGGNCFDPDCTVCATADSTNQVNEQDETNNQTCTSSIG